MMNVQSVGTNFTGNSVDGLKKSKRRSFIAGAAIGSTITAGGFLAAKKASPIINETAVGISAGVKDFGAKAWNFIKNSGGKIVDAAKWVWEGLKFIGGKAKDATKWVWNNAKSLFNKVKATTGSGEQAVGAMKKLPKAAKIALIVGAAVASVLGAVIISKKGKASADEAQKA